MSTSAVHTGSENRQKPVFSIGTTARLLELSVHTLRMYERAGLILPEKSSGNQRLYSETDLERIRCIRRAINEHKVGIEGIRRLQALIPCWNIVGCSEEDRSKCAAFHSHEGGCWTHDHANDVCGGRDCRACPVYALALDCDSVKQSIISASKADEHSITT